MPPHKKPSKSDSLRKLLFGSQFGEQRNQQMQRASSQKRIGMQMQQQSKEKMQQQSKEKMQQQPKEKMQQQMQKQRENAIRKMLMEQSQQRTPRKLSLGDRLLNRNMLLIKLRSIKDIKLQREIKDYAEQLFKKHLRKWAKEHFNKLPSNLSKEEIKQLKQLAYQESMKRFQELPMGKDSKTERKKSHLEKIASWRKQSEQSKNKKKVA